MWHINHRIYIVQSISSTHRSRASHHNTQMPTIWLSRLGGMYDPNNNNQVSSFAENNSKQYSILTSVATLDLKWLEPDGVQQKEPPSRLLLAREMSIMRISNCSNQTVNNEEEFPSWQLLRSSLHPRNLERLDRKEVRAHIPHTRAFSSGPSCNEPYRGPVSKTGSVEYHRPSS